MAKRQTRTPFVFLDRSRAFGSAIAAMRRMPRRNFDAFIGDFMSVASIYGIRGMQAYQAEIHDHGLTLPPREKKAPKRKPARRP